MTQQEQQLLNGLVERVNGTQLASKDDEAERMLQAAFGRNPDALYILCQTVLVQQFAMENAQKQLTAARAQIDELKQHVPEEKHGSFLGNLFGLGHDDAPQPQRSPAPLAPSQPAYGAPTGYAPVANAPAPQYVPQQPGYGYPQQPSGSGIFGGGGGFLQGAMQTAAGVVAGQFAFQAIEGMLHGLGGGGGRGFEGGNETVNNYFDNSDSSRDGGGFGDRLAAADGYDGGVSSDIEDRRGESSGFFGGDDDNNSSNFADDSGSDDFSNDGSGDDSDNNTF